jgi:hypothetical protein
VHDIVDPAAGDYYSLGSETELMVFSMGKLYGKKKGE